MRKALVSFIAVAIFFLVGNLYSETTSKAIVKKNQATVETQRWKEPTEFRGVPWGASVEIWKEKFTNASCMKTEEAVMGDSLCRSDFNIGKIPVKGYFWFRKGLVHVTLNFDSENFIEMVGVFKEKYGSATSEEQTEITTHGGLKYTGETYIWNGSTVEIKAERYYDTIKESQITIWLVADKTTTFEKLNRKQKKAAEDL